MLTCPACQDRLPLYDLFGNRKEFDCLACCAPLRLRGGEGAFLAAFVVIDFTAAVFWFGPWYVALPLTALFVWLGYRFVIFFMNVEQREEIQSAAKAAISSPSSSGSS